MWYEDGVECLGCLVQQVKRGGGGGGVGIREVVEVEESGWFEVEGRDTGEMLRHLESNAKDSGIG